MEGTPKTCIRCLLRDMAEADRLKLSNYINAIHKPERVTDDLYEKRLAICKKCDLLNSGTCNACGCYVELRALTKTGKCPHKKW